MGQRFYFDLVGGDEEIRDEVGVEARDLDEAMQQARSVIREMRDAGEFEDEADDWNLVVRDAAGVLARLRLQ